jgi:hypothetical protein
MNDFLAILKIVKKYKIRSPTRFSYEKYFAGQFDHLNFEDK